MFSSKNIFRKLLWICFFHLYETVGFFPEASTPFELINLSKLFYLLNVKNLEKLHLRLVRITESVFINMCYLNVGLGRPPSQNGKRRATNISSALQCTFSSRYATTWVRVDCGTSWPVGRIRIIWYSSQLVPYTTCNKINSSPCQLVPNGTRPQVYSYPGEILFKWTRTQVNSYSSQLVASELVPRWTRQC